MDTQELIKDVLSLLFHAESVPVEVRKKAIDLVLENPDNHSLLQELKDTLSDLFVKEQIDFMRGAQAFAAAE